MSKNELSKKEKMSLLTAALMGDPTGVTAAIHGYAHGGKEQALKSGLTSAGGGISGGIIGALLAGLTKNKIKKEYGVMGGSLLGGSGGSVYAANEFNKNIENNQKKSASTKMKIQSIIPTVLIKQSYSYESEVDVPLPILDKPIIGGFTNPFKTNSRIANEGGEGGIGRFTTGLLQGTGMSGGGALGGFLGALKGPRPKKGLIGLGAALGAYLGLGSGSAAAGLMHNAESRDQFAKALRGSLSEDDIPKIPSGILKVLEQGNTDKFKEMAPRFLPELMDRPYVKELIASQNPVPLK